MLSLLAIFLVMPVAMHADGYDDLWKKVEDASKRDLPKTQIGHLERIVAKAEKDRNYGQLLKAEWYMMWTWGVISPDSLQPQMARLEQKAAGYAESDPALAAVCYAALGKTCAEASVPRTSGRDAAAAYFKKAMADPAMLASKTVDAYTPFVVKGRDAALFGNDLLSLIGYTAEDYATMHSYYAKTGNRTATLLTALDMVRQDARNSGEMYLRKLAGSRYVKSLDSLISVYGDLPVCAEVAMERYNMMARAEDVTAKEKAGYIENVMKRWGSWQRIQEMDNAMKSLTNPEFTAEMQSDVMLPGSMRKLAVTVRNIDKLTLTLTRLDVSGDTELNPSISEEYPKLKAKAIGGTVKTMTKDYSGYADYEVVEDSFDIKGLPVGVYLMELSPDNKGIDPERRLLFVSDMFIVGQELPGTKIRFAAVSATTGQPVQGAKIEILDMDNKKKTLSCDVNGEVVYAPVSRSSRDRVRATCDGDNAMPFDTFLSGFYYSENKTNRDVVSLFTDRSIYRPGQTVHVAAVLRHIDKQEQTAVEGRSIKLTLKDANYKTVAEKNVTTDAYGTASADFVLPQGGLTGNYTIRTETALSGSVGFRVEEYKRPTFEVVFDEVNGKYANGDTLTVTGRAKAYSGVPVRGAKVKYTVRRNQALWWCYYSPAANIDELNSNILAEGETVTGADGTFKIDMPMVLPVWAEGLGVSRENFYRIPRFYNIVAEADVTDQAGESHNGSLSLPLGSKATAFDCNMPEKTLRDSLKTIRFTLKNSAGNDIPGDVVYTVSGIDGEFKAKVNVDTELTWNTAANLKSGKHTLTAVCGNDTVKRDFYVFSYEDTVPCVKTPDWFYVSGSEFPRDGGPVYMQFGSSDKDVHVLYTVVSDNKLLKSGTYELDGEVATRKITYKDEYGDGLRISLVWVKDGQAYSHSVGIAKPLPDKRLVLKWKTFRDRLTPGQKEEWTLNITRPDGKPAEAQLVASMYDSSLDQIEPFSWWFAPYMSQSLPYTEWHKPSFSSLFFGNGAALKLPVVPVLDFGRIDTSSGNKYGSVYGFVTQEELSGAAPGIMLRGSRVMASSTAPQKNMAMSKSASDVMADAATVEQAVLSENVVTADGKTSDKAGAGVQLRENLEETAFFYPALNADADGNVSVKFTLPESVTTWRFMGFAHDKQMNNGQIDATAVASKKVMVQPNVPRFVRVGDRAQISTRIFNTSGKKVKGTAVMQLVDPETEKTVLEVKKNFEVEADSTGAVTFNYYPNANNALLVCRIFAEGKDFSDGEQHYLPVLPNAELVTTTVPFTQHGAGTKTIDLQKLFPEGGRNEKLTVEYTNNPAWLMIQALPYIGNVDDDDVISLATAYYANSISAYLMKQSPRIKAVFDQWRLEPGQGSLMSSLERNQELKNIVLDETPWVADAGLEAEQKQLLANYFNESTLTNNLTTTLDKLRKLQNQADGSWCWWQGMPYGSFSLTASVVETLVRLDKMTGKQGYTSSMVDKAMKFLGKEVVDNVKEVKKWRKEGNKYVTNWDNAVRYLYICTLNGWQMSQEEREAADYVLADVKDNNASLSLYNKAMMAVVLAGNGEKGLAGEYVKSLDEYTVATEEMGRYYDSPRAGYSWFDYHIPTQVMAIEAMTLVDADGYASTMEEMKRWLLQQKRTQAWDTPINSVNAVYAFMNGNMSVLDSREQAKLSIDGKQLDAPEATAGLGYVKTSVVPEDANTFTVTKTSEGTSWGAVYAQSLQEMSSIESASAGFTVTREVLGRDGKPAATLNVGDRVKVRITIKADRDYDYVQVKDKRAACMEPLAQFSGYHWGYYCAPKDNATYYYFDMMGKGTHVVETEYYIDRAGRYETGTCTVECAYAPEYSARTASQAIEVK